MKVRIVEAALVLALAACNQQSSSDSTVGAPHLDAPAPESQPARTFTAANDGARAATGQTLVATTALRLPDAGQQGDAQEVLTLTGANRVAIEAQIASTVSPATQVGGQTLRALLALPVEEPQVLVYRVTNETKQNNAGLCGADPTAFVVVWDPETLGVSGYKVLGVMGAQPGDAAARACTMLEYHEN